MPVGRRLGRRLRGGAGSRRRRRHRASAGGDAGTTAGVGLGVAAGRGVTSTVSTVARSGTGPAMIRSILATARSNSRPAPSASVATAKPPSVTTRTATSAPRRSDGRRRRRRAGRLANDMRWLASSTGGVLTRRSDAAWLRRPSRCGRSRRHSCADRQSAGHRLGAGARRLRLEVERPDVARPEDRDRPPVERRDPVDAEALRGRDEERIGQARTMLRRRLEQLDGAAEIRVGWAPPAGSLRR